MEIIKNTYLALYQDKITESIILDFENFQSSLEEINMNFRIQASAVFSSNIEGNTLDLNSYLNIKMKKDLKSRKKDVTEIDDLIKAYQFAKVNELNEETFLQSHLILSKNILIKSKRGKYRNEAIGVFSENGLVYLAVEHGLLENIMQKFFDDIRSLLIQDLSISQVLYYASMIHLQFVHIHPFVDGNGRAARLLEKWFISKKLGDKYWNLLSEKYYKENQSHYYENINLGINYYELDYEKCLLFLLMLPISITMS